MATGRGTHVRVQVSGAGRTVGRRRGRRPGAVRDARAAEAGRGRPEGAVAPAARARARQGRRLAGRSTDLRRRRRCRTRDAGVGAARAAGRVRDRRGDTARATGRGQMTPLSVACGVLGLAVVSIVLWDAFETVLLPRRIGRRLRLARLFYLVTWRGWRGFTRRI